MQHKCKVTVIDKKLFPDLQKKYLADPQSGVCPFFEVGDEFVFARYADEDTFWTMTKGRFCAEAWDCVSRYVYTALQGGAIMRGWPNDDRLMIACCNDGTRPVIFKIERMDYKVVKIDGMKCGRCASAVKKALEAVPGVECVDVRLEKNWAEVFVGLENIPADEALTAAVEPCGFAVTGID